MRVINQYTDDDLTKDELKELLFRLLQYLNLEVIGEQDNFGTLHFSIKKIEESNED